MLTLVETWLYLSIVRMFMLFIICVPITNHHVSIYESLFFSEGHGFMVYFPSDWLSTRVIIMWTSHCFYCIFFRISILKSKVFDYIVAKLKFSYSLLSSFSETICWKIKVFLAYHSGFYPILIFGHQGFASWCLIHGLIITVYLIILVYFNKNTS